MRHGLHMDAHGVVVVDKPLGPTSFDVCAQLRRSFGTRAIGHAGTLDPLATGVLVVLVGDYTRLSAHLTAHDKSYDATIVFGARTSTDDLEGEVVETGDASVLTEEAVRAAAATFVGPQQQTPPVYSAIHQGGERSYEKARRGEVVELPPRDIVVHAFDVVTWTPGRAVVHIVCSKGTYIRALARDLGAKLGVPAHLGGLRRTRSGAYDIADAVPLDALMDKATARDHLLRGPSAVRGLPHLEVDDDAVRALRQGKRVPWPTAVEGVALAHRGDELIALVERRDDALCVVRGFAAA